MGSAEASRYVTPEMIDQANRLLWEESAPAYMAHSRDFTDEQIKAGELRAADAQAAAENVALMRRILEVVAGDIAAAAKLECAAELLTLTASAFDEQRTARQEQGQYQAAMVDAEDLVEMMNRWTP